MQAFLHFSTNQATEIFHEFVSSCHAICGGDDIHLLSASDHLGHAAFFGTSKAVDGDAMRNKAAALAIDCNVLSAPPRPKKLFLSDMDSTIITSESLDDIARLADLENEIAPITARAMAGEIDFEQALDERLLILKGKPKSLLDQVIADTTAFEGAKELVGTMCANDAHCLLVSGGFTFLTAHIKNMFGFHEDFANELAVDGESLAGFAHKPILDASAKLRLLRDYQAKFNLDIADIMTMGDGANDIPMLTEAGLGIAWQAKPLVKAQIGIQLSFSSLCGALFLQGYRESDILQ